MDNINYFISMFPEKLKSYFDNIEKEILSLITEIRLRKNSPIIVYILNEPSFINQSGRITNIYNPCCVKVDKDSFEFVVNKLCNNSFHTNISSMINGYITTERGCRVGIGASAVIRDNEIVSVTDINSLNIRIANEFLNCSKEIIDKIYDGNIPSIIVAGCPSAGKTTFLRDYARLISSGYKGKFLKVTIVDERKEISLGFDVGINTDVILSFPKYKGIEIATRTLSPQVIICDEIGNLNELDAIRFGFSSGVKFAVSVHLGNKQDIFNNKIIYELMATGEFDYIILLENYTYQYKIFKIQEELNEDSRNIDDNTVFYLPWCSN